MATTAAGILLFRRGGSALEVLLVHMGGPFWARKDAGAWSIPKGEVGAGEDAMAAARREFEEETGAAITEPLRAIGQLTQSGGKIVHAWAVEQDFDPARLRSNTFKMEWPAGSGRLREFPEVDRAAWFDLAEAARRILPSQRPFLDRLTALRREWPKESGPSGGD